MKRKMPTLGPQKQAGFAGKLVRAAAGLLILVGAALGVFSLFAGTKHYPLTGTGASSAQLRGAYHVHSTASDGRADLAQIADAAKRAGLAFVVMTDHNVEPLPPAQYLSGVLMIPAVEESTPSGHLVVLGASRSLTSAERAGDPVATAQTLGGFAVVAHPVQQRNPWKDWDAGTRAPGFELFSGDTMLRDALASPGRLFCAVGSYFANPTHGLLVLVRPQLEAEARLLATSGETPKVALCSSDAHGLPPYEAAFRIVATYLPPELKRLPEDPVEAAKQVVAVIAQGRTYCAFDSMGNAAGFSIEGLSDAGEGTVGDRLRVKLPPTGPALTRLTVAGGATVDADAGTVLLERRGPVEIQVELLAPGCTTGEEWRPWIVPSPIQVR